MTAKETANFVLDNLVRLNQNDKDNYLRRLIDLILKEDQELTALRFWKEKARPFLEDYIKTCHQNYYDEAVEWAGADSIQAVTIKKTINEVTELLGGANDR